MEHHLLTRLWQILGPGCRVAMGSISSVSSVSMVRRAPLPLAMCQELGRVLSHGSIVLETFGSLVVMASAH